MKSFLPLLILLASTYATPVLAQTSTEDSVKNTISQLFEGMRKGDSAMVKAVLADNVVFNGLTRDKNNDLQVTASQVQRFLTAVGTPHTDVWDERITFDKVLVDGPLASVWTPYRFYLGDKFSHCGVNSFQLYRSARGWKIFHLVDTRRKDHCL